LSIFSFRFIVISFSVLISACVAAFFIFLSAGKFFKTISLGAMALQALWQVFGLSIGWCGLANVLGCEGLA
jgi:hypothetical protein